MNECYIESKKYKNIKYVVKYPSDFRSDKKYPTILFLHGAGSRGQHLKEIYANPFFTETKRWNLEAVIFAPQCYADTWFEIFEQLINFADYVRNQKFCDKNKVYLMGASMGGYASWQLAMTRPDWFAAMIPICGGGMYWNAGRLKDVPIWAFHGAKDETVYVQESQKMVDAVNAAGGNARLTIYAENNHDSWSDTYNNYEVFEWLFHQRKK